MASRDSSTPSAAPGTSSVSRSAQSAISLRLRLALWYGGLTGAVVVLACFFSYAVHGRTHFDQLDTTLRHTAAHVAQEFIAAPTSAARDSVLDVSSRLGATVWTYGGARAMVGRADAIGPVPEVDADSVLRAPSRPAYPVAGRLAPSFESSPPEPTGTFSVAVDARAMRWRVYVSPMRQTNGGLIVAAPLDHLDSSVRAFGKVMILLASLGALVTFAAGWLLAGRALRPVAVLTEAARDIALSRVFTRRVPVSPSRDELSRLADTFNEMLVSLEQAYATQQRFVSDASHELRAPLTVIQANLELLRRVDPMSSADQSIALHEASAEADRLGRLVGDLLALARADARLPLRDDDVELDTVIVEVIEEARFLARGQVLQIGTLAPLVVRGDRDRIKQLVLVLLDNALKYTPTGGRVSIELQLVGRDAELRVRDTGIGIAPQDLPKVFERFYRSDPARAHDPGGSGLGLAIGKWIAEQHGGAVLLESVAGAGTTALVRIPASRAPVNAVFGTIRGNRATDVGVVDRHSAARRVDAARTPPPL